MKVTSLSDFPSRFCPGTVLYVESKALRILRSFKSGSHFLVLKLQGIDSRQEAEGLRGKLLTVPQKEVPPLPEGSYYHYQLLGLQVHTKEGEYLGRITEILPTGSNDVYVVSHNGSEVLIPALDPVITEVNLEKGIVTVDLPEGLR